MNQHSGVLGLVDTVTENEDFISENIFLYYVFINNYAKQLIIIFIELGYNINFMVTTKHTLLLFSNIVAITITISS